MLKSRSGNKKLRVLTLATVIYFTVSGGPYGLEPLLSFAGPQASLLLLIITPLLWDIPAMLAVLELNSMMPVTGGYYEWVKRAMGLRFGFYEGWWTWLYTFVDLAIYPVLFVEYLSFLFPQAQAYKIPVCLIIVWLGALLNIIGISPVGKTTILLSMVVIIPFIILFGITVFGTTPLHISAPSLKGLSYSSIGMALYTVMWNFFGWDNATTYAEEVEQPVRTYVKSMFIAIITVIVVYVMVIISTLHFKIDARVLDEGGFPVLGLLAGDKWLGNAIAIGGMAGACGLYASVLLSVSRVPEVMASDRLLPKMINWLHPKFGTPYISIIVCASVVSFMVLWSFEDLIVIDVTLYAAALFLEFISLLLLRIKKPLQPRPFRIPLPAWALFGMFIIPVTVFFIALSGVFISQGNSIKPALFAIVALVSAEPAWQLIRLRKKIKRDYEIVQKRV